MNGKPMRCELVSWGQVYRLSKRLAETIRKSGYRADVVVAVARGGYVPARILCDFLGFYDLTSVRIGHYAAGAHKSQQARLCSTLSLDVRDLRVLLVDDCSDTGDTLQLAQEHIRSFAPADLKVAVLHHKQVSPVTPDFYAQKVVTWRWLIYPWAVVEDVSGFLSAMSPPPASPEEALSKLHRNHGITLSRQSLESVLAAMDQDGKESR